VRSAGYRYTVCGNGEEELYDHAADPWEWHNLAGDAEHEQARRTLREQMMALLWRE
jgi:hypothetical protein